MVSCADAGDKPLHYDTVGNRPINCVPRAGEGIHPCGTSAIDFLLAVVGAGEETGRSGLDPFEFLSTRGECYRRGVMSFLLTCPNCGPRGVYEFRYGGELNPRPAAPETTEQWARYLYFKRN